MYPIVNFSQLIVFVNLGTKFASLGTSITVSPSIRVQSVSKKAN
jgi:hypothetical protein